MGKIRGSLATVADFVAPFITQADLAGGEKIVHAPFNPGEITEAAVQIFREDGVNRTQEALIRDISAFVFWAIERGERQRPRVQDSVVLLGQMNRGEM